MNQSDGMINLCIQKAFSSLPVPKISYLFGDVQNFTPQPSLWYPSYPAPNSMQLWIPLFLLIFLSSSLEILNLWATHEHDSNVAEQVYISPGLQTELLPVMSISFQVNFWQHSFVGEEKSALFGVKGRKAEEENSCSFQKNASWKSTCYREGGSVCSGVRGEGGETQTKEHFPEVQTFRCFGKSFQRGAKRKEGWKSPVVLAEPLQRMKKAFLFLLLLMVLFYSSVLFQSILYNSLILYNRFSFRQQMDLQAFL